MEEIGYGLYICQDDRWIRYGGIQVTPDPLIDFVSNGDGHQFSKEDIAIIEGKKSIFRKDFSVEEFRSLLKNGEIRDELN